MGEYTQLGEYLACQTQKKLYRVVGRRDSVATKSSLLLYRWRCFCTFSQVMQEMFHFHFCFVRKIHSRDRFTAIRRECDVAFRQRRLFRTKRGETRQKQLFYFLARQVYFLARQLGNHENKICKFISWIGKCTSVIMT